MIAAITKTRKAGTGTATIVAGINIGVSIKKMEAATNALLALKDILILFAKKFIPKTISEHGVAINK